MHTQIFLHIYYRSYVLNIWSAKSFNLVKWTSIMWAMGRTFCARHVMVSERGREEDTGLLWTDHRLYTSFDVWCLAKKRATDRHYSRLSLPPSLPLRSSIRPLVR